MLGASISVVHRRVKTKEKNYDKSPNGFLTTHPMGDTIYMNPVGDIVEMY